MSTDAVAETTETVETQEPSFDIDAAVEKIGSELFPQAEASPDRSTPAAPEKSSSLPPSTTVSAPAQVAPPADSTAPADQPAPIVREAPKSWPKEMHDHWGKTPKEVQDYWEKREKQMLDGLDQYKQGATIGKQFQDVLTPYQQTLHAQGLDGPRAVQTLLSAHARLTTGPMESRIQAYKELGQNLKLNVNPEPAVEEPPLDPRVQELNGKVSLLEQTIQQQQQAAYQDTFTKVQKEVEAFASDPAHPYFDECHDHIVTLIKSGATLQDAYDQAVWANPVTRAKELARVQTETEAKFKENARLSALPKKAAAGVNVRSRDSQRSPTEAAEGTIEDTLKDTLKSIKGRTN